MRILRGVGRGLGVLLLASVSNVADADWPQFRGPRGDGHSTETGLPLTWSEDHNVAWKVPLPGRGWSSPVVIDGKVWLTTAFDEKHTLHALALDLRSGEIVHDVEVFHPSTWQETHPENSYASPTPVAESGGDTSGEDTSGRIYVHFGAYGTASLSAADGEVLWRSDDPVARLPDCPLRRHRSAFCGGSRQADGQVGLEGAEIGASRPQGHPSQGLLDAPRHPSCGAPAAHQPCRWPGQCL